MRTLIYSIAVSLDGYINDAAGSLDWVPVDEEYHRFANDMQARTSLSIYGTRMWRTMVYWNGVEDAPGHPDFMLDFARLWKPAAKLVASRTLQPTDMAAGATLLRDNVVEHVRRLKAEPGGTIAVSGATLASSLVEAGLVDEIQPFIVPALLGGGTRFLDSRRREDFALADSRRLGNGMTYLRCVRR